MQPNGAFQADDDGRSVFVVDGDRRRTGRWSKLRQPTPKAQAKKLIGVKAHFREETLSPSTDLYFFQRWLLRSATGG